MNREMLEQLLELSKVLNQPEVEAAINGQIDSFLKVFTKLIKSVSRSEYLINTTDEIASIYRTLVNSFKEQGFSEEQAIQIICSLKGK